MKLFAFAYILNIIDYFFTAYWVRSYGIMIESNPFGKWLFENNIAWFFKIVVLGGAFALLSNLVKKRPKYWFTACLLCVAYGLLVLYHFALFIIIKFNLLKIF